MNAYAEKLLANASTPARPAVAALGGTLSAHTSVPLSPALAKLPALLKISQAAEYLAISEDAVWNFRDLGVLAFIDIRVPGASRASWRIDRASLAEFETRRAVKP